jgi:hypothetical protein
MCAVGRGMLYWDLNLVTVQSTLIRNVMLFSFCSSKMFVSFYQTVQKGLP